MPILKRFNQNISVCRERHLHMPSRRPFSCIASSLSYLNGVSSYASISAFPMPASASVRCSSPWSHFNMPRPVFNYLACPSQLGGYAQRTDGVGYLKRPMVLSFPNTSPLRMWHNSSSSKGCVYFFSRY